MPQKKTTYMTRHEKAYISGLGSWGLKRKPRARALKQYIKVCERRVVWGLVDKDEAIKYAMEELRRADEK